MKMYFMFIVSFLVKYSCILRTKQNKQPTIEREIETTIKPKNEI